jgi:hypothetical protein
VSKQTTHVFHVERFNLEKLNEVEGKEQYHIEASNRFTASEQLNSEVDINRTCSSELFHSSVLAKCFVRVY